LPLDDENKQKVTTWESFGMPEGNGQIRILCREVVGPSKEITLDFYQEGRARLRPFPFEAFACHTVRLTELAVVDCC